MRELKFKNGDVIPNLGLGTWKSKPGEVYEAVLEAIKIGYRHFDCAFIYENEAEIGRALQKAFNENWVTREELWITSKLWNNAHKTENVLPALKKTLADLQLDYLDLYLVHWPIAFKENVMFPDDGEDFIPLEQLPIINTWKGMEIVQKKGLCKHIGVSNFSIKKLKNLIEKATIQPEMNQVELHPLLQQNDLLAFCNQHDIFMTGYSPLGSKDREGRKEDEPDLFENPVVNEIARAHNCTAAQVIIRWAMQRGTAVIPKSVNPSRLQENFETLEIVLTTDEMKKMLSLDEHYRFLDGEFWAKPNSGYTVENLWDE